MKHDMIRNKKKGGTSCFSSMTQLHARFEDAAWRIALGLMSSDFAFPIK